VEKLVGEGKKEGGKTLPFTVQPYSADSWLQGGLGLAGAAGERGLNSMANPRLPKFALEKSKKGLFL